MEKEDTKNNQNSGSNSSDEISKQHLAEIESLKKELSASRKKNEFDSKFIKELKGKLIVDDAKQEVISTPAPINTNNEFRKELDDLKNLINIQTKRETKNQLLKNLNISESDYGKIVEDLKNSKKIDLGEITQPEVQTEIIRSYISNSRGSINVDNSPTGVQSQQEQPMSKEEYKKIILQKLREDDDKIPVPFTTAALVENPSSDYKVNYRSKLNVKK